MMPGGQRTSTTRKGVGSVKETSYSMDYKGSFTSNARLEHPIKRSRGKCFSTSRLRFLDINVTTVLYISTDQAIAWVTLPHLLEWDEVQMMMQVQKTRGQKKPSPIFIHPLNRSPTHLHLLQTWTSKGRIHNKKVQLMDEVALEINCRATVLTSEHLKLYLKRNGGKIFAHQFH